MMVNGNHVPMGSAEGYEYGDIDSDNGNDDEIDSNEAAHGGQMAENYGQDNEDLEY